MTLEKIYFILTCILIAISLVSSAQPLPDCNELLEQRTTYITHPCSLQKSRIPDSNITAWPPPKEKLKLKLVDPEKGILSVKFPVPDELRHVEVILLLNESAIKEEDCKDSIHRKLSKHSMKSLYLNQCTLADSGTCSSCETGYLETELQFVFTGCYVLKVIPRSAEGIRLNGYSHDTFIKSSYKKKDVEQPGIDYEYSPNKYKLTVELPLNQYWSPNTQLKVYCPEPVSSAKALCPMGRETMILVDLSPNITTQQCEMTNPKHKHPTCETHDGNLTCRILNVTPGNYNMKAKVLNDARCDSPVWQDSNCSWNYSFGLSGTIQPISEPVVSTNGSIFYLYIALGTVVSLVLLAAFIHFLRSRDPPHSYAGPDEVHNIDKILIPPKEKVLLLYAQDCSHFMELMATFRNILQKVYSCEVHDIFDPCQWNTIAISQHEWVHRLLSKDDIKIIIVDSTSAVLHQKALDNRCSINYFQPRPNSHLFTYALQTMTNNVQPNAYTRIFVIRFNGFSEDQQTLWNLAPLRRYLLPDHQQQLLSDFKKSSCVDVEDSLLEELSVILQTQLDSLVSYKAQNPEYLRSVLYKTSEVA